MRLLLALLALLWSAGAFAHPSRGIVVAPDGRVYFSDLERIWSVAPDGRLTLLRRQSGHTHALAMGRGGDLLGEESNYDPSGQSYSESIWRITPSGRFSIVYGPVSSLPRGAGLLRDARGCTWHSDQTGRGGRPLVHRKCPGWPAERLVGSAADDRAFRPELINDVAGTFLASDGTFYFRQGSAVRKVRPDGGVRLVADGLASENFGIAVDPRGNLYVAEHSARRIVRIAPGGRRAIVASAAAPWAPTGVAFRGGALYLLESTDHARGVPVRMRVRKIVGDRSRTLATVSIPLR